MKKLSCLLIEDNEFDAQLLMEMLKQQALFQQMDWSQTTADAYHRLVTTTYDLIFLDMHMPDQQGIEFLHDTPNQPPVIVVTAGLEYAARCYELDVVGFLVKPFERFRLYKAINRALSGSRTGLDNPFANSIFLQTNRQQRRFRFNDIQFIEAHGTYTKIHTLQEITVVSHAISALEAQLPATQFMRVQKSFIINLNHITAVEARCVWINTTKVAVGAQYVDLLQKSIRRDGQNPTR
ncbi:LytR/AlgR family response regulator transcription factor [Spirosoma jeollabukense]